MLCVTVVYLRDITNTIFRILHLNVSCLIICCSCSQFNSFQYIFIAIHENSKIMFLYGKSIDLFIACLLFDWVLSKLIPCSFIKETYHRVLTYEI